MSEEKKDPSKLSEENTQKLLQWIQSKQKGDFTCPLCKEKSWEIQDRLVAPPGFGVGLLLGGTVYPQAMVICKNCGNTQYFNAMMAGIVEKKEDKKEEDNV